MVDNLIHDDPFLVLADYRSYVDCQDHVSRVWNDRDKWSHMSILNSARSGSSRRTVRSRSTATTSGRSRRCRWICRAHTPRSAASRPLSTAATSRAWSARSDRRSAARTHTGRRPRVRSHPCIRRSSRRRWCGRALGEQLADHPGVVDQRGRVHRVQRDGALHVPELADVELPALHRGPAQERGR